MGKFNFTLLKKALLATGLILLPVLVTFMMSYATNKVLLEKHLLEDLSLISDGFEGQLYQFIEMSERRAIDFASDGSIMDALKDGRPSKVLSAHLKRDKLPLDRQIHAIYVTSADGTVIASTDDGAHAMDSHAARPLVRSIMGRASVADSRHGPSDTPEVAVTSTVTGAMESTIGTVTNFIYMSELERVLTGEFARGLGALSAGQGPRRTLEAYLVNKDGFMITSSRFIKDSVLRQRVDTEPVRACLQDKKEVTGSYVDYRGIEVVGASMCMPDLGWTLLVEVDRAEALYPVWAIGRNALVAAAAVALLIGVLLLAFYKTIVTQLVHLAKAAQRMSEGDYGQAVPVKSRDEIGFLSETFNRMAEQIRERSDALNVAGDRLFRAQHIAKMGSWDWDITGNTLWWSDEIYVIFGLRKDGFAASYEAFLDSVHPADREFVEDSVKQALYAGRPYSIDHRIVLPGGEEKIVHEEASIIFAADGRPVRMIGAVQDITERKKAEFELKKLSAVIENSVNLVFITDRAGTIEYVNPIFEQVTGYSKGEALGQNPRILSSGETTNAQYQEMWRTILSGKTWRTTLKNRRKVGGYYWASSVITPIKNEHGEITHFLAVQEDVTERMVSEERIKYLANFDELTGLINRARFVELVEEWANVAPARGARAVLLLLDMDQFKLLNDTFGHGAGDEFLRRLSRVLKGTLSDITTRFAAACSADPFFARLSGDEFAVYLPGLSEPEGIEAAEEIRKAVEGFYFAEASSSLTASLGLAAYPAHGLNVKELLSKADAAMYRAKELGRNRVHVYRDEDHDLEKLHSRLAWREKIVKGLKEDRFTPWFQPILDLSTGTIHHYEALARLVGEDGAVVLPGAFIDIAERFGLVGLIDRMIIRKAMEMQASKRKEGLRLSFAMNLSGKDLGDNELLDYIKTKIDETGADPSALVFEITETAAISDLEKATSFVRALKEIGCHFSLDDFGVGFTSFTYLKELQVDFIKIDGIFIRKLQDNPNDQVFVKAITALARGLRIKSVAEFVENEKSLALLRAFGVDFAQGYHIGKPAPKLERAGEHFRMPD